MTKFIIKQSDWSLIDSLSVYQQTRIWFWLNPDSMWIKQISSNNVSILWLFFYNSEEDIKVCFNKKEHL